MVNKFTLVVAFVTLVLTAMWYRDASINRREDKQAKWRESQPNLVYVQNSAAYENGYTVLTLKNRSSVAPAAITAIRFLVTDAAGLARIERKHPKPQEPVEVSSNVVDNVVFTEGEWFDDNYCFSLRLSNHIPPSSVNDLRLAIVNPKWTREKFRGKLTIEYGGSNSPLQLNDVTIHGRRRK